MALNYQTDDQETMLNRAMFSGNGGCGYRLKPRYLREPQLCPSYSPTSAEGLDRIRLIVEILSGQHIPRPDNYTRGEVIAPFVEVTVRGHRADSGEKNSFKTKTVTNNGFSPSWREKFEFHLEAPELAFLEFKVCYQ